MVAGMIDSVATDIAPDRKGSKASIARLLALAATPTFAIMALLTAAHRGSMPDMICAATPDGSPMTGMMPMYLLMSAFHLAPWLGLLDPRR
jgi:hypothetical protein